MHRIHWLGCALTCAVAAAASAQVLDPFYAPFYTVINQGFAPGVPAPYGGLTVSADDPNILLIGGRANQFNADIFALRFSRENGGRMVAFECGDAEFFADANGATGGIDGGLTYGPGGVLFYTTYNDHRICQILPGGTGPARITPLADVGMAGSTGSLAFVPVGFPGAGRLKVLSYNASRWYDTTVTEDIDGTYIINPRSSVDIFIGGGPEGAVYIAAGNPGFAVDSVLVSEWGAGRVVSYEIDANGDPIVETRRVFLSGLSGAEGAAIDPVTGDFLFSTFGGGDRIIRVTGFTGITPPGDLNCDGVVTVTDIAGFVLAITNPVAYGDQFPDCDVLNADVNDDDNVTVSDIAPFVDLLTSGISCGD